MACAGCRGRAGNVSTPLRRRASELECSPQAIPLWGTVSIAALRGSLFAGEKGPPRSARKPASHAKCPVRLSPATFCHLPALARLVESLTRPSPAPARLVRAIFHRPPATASHEKCTPRLVESPASLSPALARPSPATFRPSPASARHEKCPASPGESLASLDNSFSLNGSRDSHEIAAGARSILPSHMGNTGIPQSLKDRLRRDEVVPFVGAGVSRAVFRRDGQPLFPGWRDLLLHAADRLNKEVKESECQVVRGLLGLKPPDYLDAARRAKAGLGPLWPEFLQQEIGRRSEEADPESLALARAVWGLGNRLVVTTNYDRVLEWAFPDQDLDIWDIEAPVEQAQLLRSGRPAHPTIWHLHGRIGNSAQLILTPDGYSRLYENDSAGLYQAALRTFQTLIASRSIFFIGFSFEDQALGVQLKGVHDLFAGATGPHYVLIHAQEEERLRALNLPVEPIVFADFGEPLLTLVQSIGEIAREGGTSPAAETSMVTSLSPLPGASYSTSNPPFFVPFRAKGDRVVGAEQALQRVRDQLTQGHPTSIGQTAAFQGLGGLGKTQLAVEYACRFSADYPNGVIWLTADQDIPAQLTRLAVEAKWVASESEHKVKLDVAQHRVRSYSGCLIIFDNVEEPTAIKPYLPLPSAQPHILITSRTPQPGFVPIPLDFLDEEQSLAVLISEARRSPAGEAEEDAAREIASELGGLPLALEMAGAYLLHRQIQWQQYREFLRKNPKAALSTKVLDSFTHHEAELFATLSIQEGLFEDEPLLREVLDILTWSGSAPMGLSLLAAILSKEETDLLGALSLGVKLRLLESSIEVDRYSLHRLVRKVRQEDRPLIKDPKWVEDVCRRLGDWFFARRQNFEDLAIFEAEIDHLQQWREQAQALSSTQASRLTWLLAYPPFHRGQYAESHRWLDQAFALFELEANLDQELKACLWSDLGIITSWEGRVQAAFELDERALAIRLEILGEEHLDTATSFSNIGSFYGIQGDLDKALEYSKKALAIRRKKLGEGHPNTAVSLSNIGNIYLDRSDLDEALNYHSQSLAIRHKKLGEGHPDTATSLSNIGIVYQSRGDLGEALDYHNQALAIQRKVLGEEHPDTAASLSNIGQVYQERGDLDKALDYYSQALAIQRKMLGEEHPDTANSLSKFGTLYQDRGNLDEALDHYSQGLAIRRKVFGEEHPSTALSLNNLGGAYFEYGDSKQAAELLREALTINQKTLGLFHFDTISCTLNLAKTLNTLGRRQEAFALIDSYIKNSPGDPEQVSQIKTLAHQLKATPFRPGFRLPPAQGKKKPKKKHR